MAALHACDVRPRGPKELPREGRLSPPEQALQVVHPSNGRQRQAVDLHSPTRRVPAHVQAELAAGRRRRRGITARRPPPTLQGTAGGELHAGVGNSSTAARCRAWRQADHALGTAQPASLPRTQASACLPCLPALAHTPPLLRRHTPCAPARAPPTRSSRCQSSSAAGACAAARWGDSWSAAAWHPPGPPC